MFSDEYRSFTLFGLAAGIIGGPIIFLLGGDTLGEALYVGIPIGLGAGFLSAAPHWRIEELARRRRS